MWMVIWSKGSGGGTEKMIMSRFLIPATTGAFLAAQMLGAAHAATVTYDLALTPVTGIESGTGTLVVTGPISGTETLFTNSGLDSLSFAIDGNNFTLANALFSPNVTFVGGNLASISYTGILNGVTFVLDTGGLFYIYNSLNNLAVDTVGTISASATPLPATWTMMLIGLAGFGFMLYRRKERDLGAVCA
jgi:hypothetical protein